MPKAGGEDVLRLRGATVDAVNSDGTVDNVMSWVVVPNVVRLSNAAAVVGESVQVLIHRGLMLVIGPTNGAFGWRPIASGSLAGQSQVSIPVPVGMYSQLRLTLVGTRASGAGAGEIWCRVNNVSS